MTPNVQTPIGLSGGLGLGISLDAFQVNSTLPGNSPTFFPTTGPALLSLFSKPSLSEWLMLLAVGGIFMICRCGWFSVYQRLFDYFFITVDIEPCNPCHHWITAWLNTHPSWSNPRNVQLEYASAEKFTYKPSHSSFHSFWYNRRYIRINRWEKEATAPKKRKEEFLRLRILSRNHQILTDFLREAEAVYNSTQEGTISIYVSEICYMVSWRRLTTRRKRPLNSIILDPGIKDQIIKDAREFLASEDWYAARGIPFRRGYLLYGKPGTGKTSMIQSLAGELELDIYIISLSRKGMDDHVLNEVISQLPKKCIALLEDVDAALTTTINRDRSKIDTSTDSPQAQEQVSKVTLSGLLNALDGVAAQEGRLLFATTNKYHSLDPALIRPGRMDLHIEFELTSRHQARELYQRFYSPDGVIKAEASKISEEDEMELLLKKEPVVQAYEISSDVFEEGTGASQKQHSSPRNEAQAGTYSGPSSNTSLLSSSQLEKLATMFSGMLPEREFSMASLQGYLMLYKAEPVAAVRNFMEWIEKVRKERRERLGQAETGVTVGEVGVDTPKSPTT